MVIQTILDRIGNFHILPPKIGFDGLGVLPVAILRYYLEILDDYIMLVLFSWQHICTLQGLLAITVNQPLRNAPVRLTISSVFLVKNLHALWQTNIL